MSKRPNVNETTCLETTCPKTTTLTQFAKNEFWKCGNYAYSAWITTTTISFCNCGQIKIEIIGENINQELKDGCCPGHGVTCSKAKERSATGAKCPIGVIQTFGSYCKSLQQCLVQSVDKTAIPCKISGTEDYSCSNQTDSHKVCRGMIVTTCKKCVSMQIRVV